MTTAAPRFEADQLYASRALVDARGYNTDVDSTGRKAEAIYERLARAQRLMYPWSTDGTPAQAKRAIDYLQEITAILSEKIGPASRREFHEQGGSRAPDPQWHTEAAPQKPSRVLRRRRLPR